MIDKLFNLILKFWKILFIIGTLLFITIIIFIYLFFYGISKINNNIDNQKTYNLKIKKPEQNKKYYNPKNIHQYNKEVFGKSVERKLNKNKLNSILKEKYKEYKSLEEYSKDKKNDSLFILQEFNDNYEYNPKTGKYKRNNKPFKKFDIQKVFGKNSNAYKNF